MDSHVRLFHLIARGYYCFFRSQQRMFRSIIAEQAEKAGAEPGDSFLDVGCGTGALKVLEEAGFRAGGLDAAPKMVRIAQAAGCNCVLGDIAAGLPYPNASFDFVIIHDYRGRQSCMTELIERLEGGDFFGFALSGEAHMRRPGGAEQRAETLERSRGGHYAGRVPVNAQQKGFAHV